MTMQKMGNEGVSHYQKEAAWQVQAARVEDGWQMVKGKKEKRGEKEPFEMILRSQWVEEKHSSYPMVLLLFLVEILMFLV